MGGRKELEALVDVENISYGFLLFFSRTSKIRTHTHRVATLTTPKSHVSKRTHMCVLHEEKKDKGSMRSISSSDSF